MLRTRFFFLFLVPGDPREVEHEDDPVKCAIAASSLCPPPPMVIERDTDMGLLKCVRGEACDSGPSEEVNFSEMLLCSN